MMKRVLFVDDEPAILDGLRSRLHHKRKEWEMVFVLGGQAAIEQMEAKPFAAIVSDLRMPGMDGGKLLAIVNERWPETVRIVLSGYSEQEQTVRVVRYAHQYLSKPCEPHHLENVVERCVNLQALLGDAKLRALVGRINKLPAVPKTYAQLCEAMTKPDISAEEVGRIVGRDIAIAAKVLQVVNSAFFRLARRINKIEQAVTYLGFTAIRNLVMSTEVFSQWKSGSGDFDAVLLQAHAQTVAAAARALTDRTPLADDAMLAGMLHDIGYLILAQECPQEFAEAIAESRRTGETLYQVERRLLGASHAEIGAYLLGLWGLPYSVIEAVAYHHEPERVTQTQFDVLSAVAMAESLTAAMESGTVRALDAPRPTLDGNYLQTLNAPFDFADARGRVEGVYQSMNAEAG